MELRCSAEGSLGCISFRFRLCPALDLRRSETDSRPMLEPRDCLGEALGFAGAPDPGVADIVRDEIEVERDGGRELRSGDIFR
jgi:hypothetical protein